MKIKEVCKRTGLTERTIRYYGEERLIKPLVTLKGGREYREYSERDVAGLTVIAGLRKLFFTIDEIKDMIDDPERIQSVLSAYKLKMATDAKAKAAIVEALNDLEPSELRSAEAVAEKLRRLSERLPLPQRDINPDFGKFESNTKAERELEYSRFAERQAKQFALGRIIVIVIASVNIFMSLMASVIHFNAFNLIVQIVLSICLFFGVSWVRYLFAVGAALSVLGNIVLIITALGEGLVLTAALSAVYMAYSVVACLFLFRSEAVTEFLYAQKHG